MIAAGRRRPVRQAYAECDIICCPSLRESFSRVVVEAMANGLPVVASDIPAHRALLADAGAGLLFPLNHPRLAGEAIARLAANRPLREQLGRAGRLAAQRFEPSPIVGQLLQLYAGSHGKEQPIRRRTRRERLQTLGRP